MATTHLFAAALAATIGAKVDSLPALASVEVLGGSGTVVVANVISAVAASVVAAPDGAGGTGGGGAVDVVDADIAGGAGGAAVGRVYEVRCQVVMQGTGDLLAVQSFRFDVPEGSLGSSLSVVLADPAPVVTEDDRIRVRIGIQDGPDTEWVKLIANARIRSVSKVTTYLGDRISFVAINPMADKFARSPRSPIVLYDPEQVTLIELTGQQARDIVDEDRNPITPEFRAVEGLDLLQLLNFVWVEKCGFDSVVTNIPNFPLKRCDFQIEQPWSAVSNAEIGAFRPCFGDDGEGVLFILDPMGTLPEGLAAPKLKPRGYATLKQDKQMAGKFNACILNYRDNTKTAGDFTGGETDLVDPPDEDEVGTYGQPGWQRTLTYKFHKLFHDTEGSPDDISRDITWKIDQHTSAVVDGVVREIAVESQVDRWSEDWRLMLGYTKSIQIYAKLPGESVGVMRDCETHVNTISYAVSQSQPGETYKIGETTKVTGTVLSTDNGDDPPTLISLYQAHQNNSVTDDQDVLFATPISSIVERWQQVADDQITQRYVKINQLTGACEQNKTFHHTGTLAVRTPAQGVTARMLLTIGDIPEEEARVPLQFNAGNIPFELALPLARRELEMRGATPRKMTWDYAGLDLRLGRGSLRRIFDRDGTILKTFTEGYWVSGDPGSRGSIVVSMGGTGVVIGEEAPPE